MDFFTRLFDTSGFPARWRCGSGWADSPWVGWLHILADLGVWSAYLAIPLVLMFFILRRKDLPFRKIFVLFGAFILACGTTHLMEAIIFWWPAYRLAGVIKLATALVSWGTVVALVPVVPRVLAMRSPEELEREIAARTAAESALHVVNTELEQRIENRTAELFQVNRQLRAEDQKKNEFLAVLAHELRNPLAPITNALEIMHLGADGAEAESLRAMMERQVRQMLHLIDDLLDVSRITSGKIVLRKERLELSAVVTSALETSRPLIEAARHDLTVALPPQPIYVVGDKTRLAQVLSNLLANSVKYTTEQGHIWLTVSAEHEQVAIRVRDTGMGIPAEMLPLIFDMFTQVDRNLGRAQGGMGIGLSLVRTLVEIHGGTVEAHSGGPGQGSEFVVRLPLAPAEPKPAAEDVRPQAVTQATPRLPQRRVLVVDDNLDSADTLRRLLEIMGHQVRVAHDGPPALEIAATYRPEVVLLDIGLPSMSGYEVASQMRQMPTVRNALLIAQTGWGQESDKRRSAEVGFNAHLVKPVDAIELRRLLAASP